ncbi:MAG: V-type ATPase 116kDa subunit family protein [Bacteroidota bacterium]|nr:V-type ATPase 116kDa subunit family protein [Bacteroidota bacterium]
MKKYSFLIFHQEYVKFLEKLQNLGVLHIVEREKSIDNETQETINQINEITKTQKFLHKKEVNEDVKVIGDFDNGIELKDAIKNSKNEISDIEQESIVLTKEIAKLKPWGNYSGDVKNKFAKMGLTPCFYTCSEKNYDTQWEADYYLSELNSMAGIKYFVILREKGQNIDIKADEFSMPDVPLSELIEKEKQYKEKINEINNFFDSCAINYQELLETTKLKLQEEVEFKLALKNTKKEADEKVMLLEGWVPENKQETINNFLDENNIYYLSENPKAEDKVPILLKNNKFVKLFEPIGNLFSLPDYAELDMTPFLAPFFMLFFGFCVGDTGYGLFILIATLIFRKKAKPDLKPILTLASWLGVATIIMGMVSGTFFGVELAKLDFISFNEVFLEPLDMFYLSIGLGIVQIIFGMFIKVINQIKLGGFKYGISTMGWIFLIFSMGTLMGLEKLGIEFALSGILKNIFLVISAVMIILFSNPEKSILANVGIGLYDVYNMLTGVFGDILSYIRLFALGISSAILGLVFNQIASQFLSIHYVGWIFFILLLIVGHGLNIFLAGLGAFVHPLRLTFVEFYKNAGFTGGGKKYKPFSK